MNSFGRPWGHSNAIGYLYRAEEHRFGHNQKGRGVNDGDLVMPVEHSGDHFYYFILVTEKAGRLTGHPEIRIGAYSFGAPPFKLTDREYHLLAAGETITKP